MSAWDYLVGFLKATVIAIIFIVLIFYCLGRIGANEAQKNQEPVACQLFGGHWSAWNGWKCQS